MALRILLGIIGLAMIYLGADTALGGIQSMGLQGSRDFLTITDEARFAVQDNHIRFLGGMFVGAGVLFCDAAFDLRRSGRFVIGAISMIFIGGLTRIMSLDLAVVFSADILPSLIAELIILPLIALWIWRRLRLEGPGIMQ